MTDVDRSEPILDLEVVAELRASTGDDDEFMRDLIATYVDEATGHLDAMASAVDAGDPAAIVRPSHTLKSSSASLGALRLAAICRGIEAAGREERADRLADDVELARTTWAATLDALRREELVA